jgi:hypothetical protein
MLRSRMKLTSGTVSARKLGGVRAEMIRGGRAHSAAIREVPARGMGRRPGRFTTSGNRAVESSPSRPGKFRGEAMATEEAFDKETRFSG